MKDDIKVVEPTDEEILGEYIESKNRELEMNQEEISNIKKNGKELVDKLMGATKYDEKGYGNEKMTIDQLLGTSKSFGSKNIEDLIKQESNPFISKGDKNTEEARKELDDKLKNANEGGTSEVGLAIPPTMKDNRPVYYEPAMDDKLKTEFVDMVTDENQRRTKEKMDPKVAKLVKGSVNNSRIPVKGKTYKNKSVDKKTIALVTAAFIITAGSLMADYAVFKNDYNKEVIETYDDMLEAKVNKLPEEQQAIFEQAQHDSDKEKLDRVDKSYAALDNSYLTMVEESKSNLNKKVVGAIDQATDEELKDILYFDIDDGSESKGAK